MQPDVELPGIEPGEMLYDYFYDQVSCSLRGFTIPSVRA